jgi:hypothetical protein
MKARTRRNVVFVAVVAIVIVIVRSSMVLVRSLRVPSRVCARRRRVNRVVAVVVSDSGCSGSSVSGRAPQQLRGAHVHGALQQRHFGIELPHDCVHLPDARGVGCVLRLERGV